MQVDAIRDVLARPATSYSFSGHAGRIHSSTPARTFTGTQSHGVLRLEVREGVSTSATVRTFLRHRGGGLSVTVADSIPDTDARLSVVTDEPVRAIDVARLGTVMTRTDHLVEIALDVEHPTDLSTLELLSCTQLRLELRRVRLAVQMSMDIALSDASFC